LTLAFDPDRYRIPQMPQKSEQKTELLSPLNPRKSEAKAAASTRAAGTDPQTQTRLRDRFSGHDRGVYF